LRKKFVLRSKIFLGIFLFSISMSGSVFATPAEDAELEQLNKIDQELELQRDWVKYRLDKASSECYKNYWVNYCLRKAREKYREELDPITVQERALHAAQRDLRKSIKDQDDEKRAADRASPEKAAERADNQRQYEEKQKAAAERAADREQRRKDAPKRAQENKAGTQID
jgi:septal ring factor EnvC (AmiA/AmiB activator)